MHNFFKPTPQKLEKVPNVLDIDTTNSRGIQKENMTATGTQSTTPSAVSEAMKPQGRIKHTDVMEILDTPASKASPSDVKLMPVSASSSDASVVLVSDGCADRNDDDVLEPKEMQKKFVDELLTDSKSRSNSIASEKHSVSETRATSFSNVPDVAITVTAPPAQLHHFFVEAAQRKAHPAQVVAPNSATARPTANPFEAKTPAAKVNPFGAKTGASAATPAAVNPFGTKTPAAANPFGAKTPAAKVNPLGAKTGASAATPAAVNPFGARTPAAANPFGTKTPAAKVNPLGAKTGASAATPAAVNPFGARTPAAANPFGAKTPAAKVNPFGAKAPATSPTEQSVVESIPPLNQLEQPVVVELLDNTPAPKPKGSKVANTKSSGKSGSAAVEKKPIDKPKLLPMAVSNATPGLEPASIFRKKESKEVLRQREQQAAEERRRIEEEQRAVAAVEAALAAELERKRRAEEYEAKFQLQLQQSKRDAEAMFKHGSTDNESIVGLFEDTGSASKRRRGRQLPSDSDEEVCDIIEKETQRESAEKVGRNVSAGSSGTASAPLNTGFFAKRSVSAAATTTGASAGPDGVGSVGASSTSILDANCAIPFPLLAPVPAYFSFDRESSLFTINVDASPPSSMDVGAVRNCIPIGSGYWLSDGLGGAAHECEWRQQDKHMPTSMVVDLCADDESVIVLDDDVANNSANCNISQMVRSPTDAAVDWIRGEICNYKASINWSLFWRGLVSHYYCYSLPTFSSASASSDSITDMVSEPSGTDAVAKVLDKLRNPCQVNQFSACSAVMSDSSFVNSRKQPVSDFASSMSAAVNSTSNTQFTTILNWLSGRATKARLPAGAATAQMANDTNSRKRPASSSSGRRVAASSSSSSYTRRDRWNDSGSDEDDDDVFGVNAAADADSNNILVIQGPHSSGKSSVVHACAEQLKYNVIEINASQCRSHDEIKRICREAMQSRGLNFSDASSRPNVFSAAAAAGQHSKGKLTKTKSKTKAATAFIDPKNSKRGRGRISHVLRDEEEEEDAEEEEVQVIEPAMVTPRKDLNLILFEDVDILFEGEDFGFHNAILSLMKDAKCPVILTCTKWGGHGVSGQNDPARFALDRLIKGLHKDNVPLIVHLQEVTGPVQCTYGSLLLRELTRGINTSTLAEISQRLPLRALVEMLMAYSYSDIRGLLQSLAVLLLGTKSNTRLADSGAGTIVSPKASPGAFERYLRYHWHLDFSYMDHLKDVFVDALVPARQVSTVDTTDAHVSATPARLALHCPSVREVEPRICKSVGGHVVTVLGSQFAQPQYTTGNDVVDTDSEAPSPLAFAAVSVYLRCSSGDFYSDIAIANDQVCVISDHKIQFMLPPLEHFGLYAVIVEVAALTTSNKRICCRSDGTSIGLFGSTGHNTVLQWTVADSFRDEKADICFDSSSNNNGSASSTSATEWSNGSGAWILVVDYEFASVHQLLSGGVDSQITNCTRSIAASNSGSANSTYSVVRQYRRQLYEQLKANTLVAQHASLAAGGRRGKRRGTPTANKYRLKLIHGAHSSCPAADASDADAATNNMKDDDTVDAVTAACDESEQLAEESLADSVADVEGEAEDIEDQVKVKVLKDLDQDQEQQEQEQEQQQVQDDDDDFEDTSPDDSDEIEANVDADRWITSLPLSSLTDASAVGAVADCFVIAPLDKGQRAHVSVAVNSMDVPNGLDCISRMLDAWSDSDVLGAGMSSLYHNSLLQGHPESADAFDDFSGMSSGSQSSMLRSVSAACLTFEDSKLSRSESGDMSDFFSSRAVSTGIASRSANNCCVSVHCCSSPNSYASSLLAGDAHGATTIECERELNISADLADALRNLAVRYFSVGTESLTEFRNCFEDSMTTSSSSGAVTLPTAPPMVDLASADDDTLFESVSEDGSQNSFLQLYAKFNGPTHCTIKHYMDFIKIRHEFRDFLSKNILYPGGGAGSVGGSGVQADLYVSASGSVCSRFIKPIHGNRTDLSHSFFCATLPYLCLIMKSEELSYHHYADYCRRRAVTAASASARSGNDDQDEEFDDDLYASCYGGGGLIMGAAEFEGGGGRLSRTRSSGRSTRSAGKSQAQTHLRFPYTTSNILPSASSAQLEHLLYTYGLSLY